VLDHDGSSLCELIAYIVRDVLCSTIRSNIHGKPRSVGNIPRIILERGTPSLPRTTKASIVRSAESAKDVS